jgi:hypothetical protein
VSRPRLFERLGKVHPEVASREHLAFVRSSENVLTRENSRAEKPPPGRMRTVFTTVADQIDRW